MRIDPSNVFAMPVVAGDYATTSIGDKGVSQNYAENIVLIAAIQTRHNNRFVISGSLDFFSDSYYAENADNQVLGDQLSLCMRCVLFDMQGCASSRAICECRTSSTTSTSARRIGSIVTTRSWCRRCRSRTCRRHSRCEAERWRIATASRRWPGTTWSTESRTSCCTLSTCRSGTGTSGSPTWFVFRIVLTVGRRPSGGVCDVESVCSQESDLLRGQG